MNNERISMNLNERQRVTYVAQSFELYDSKGRDYGYSYAIYCEVWAKDEDGRWLIPADEVGNREGMSWVVEPQGLRGGKHFGAIPVRSRKRFKTLGEAFGYGGELIGKARKAAEKKAVA